MSVHDKKTKVAVAQQEKGSVLRPLLAAVIVLFLVAAGVPYLQKLDEQSAKAASSRR